MVDWIVDQINDPTVDGKLSSVLLSGAEGLSSLTSIGTSSRFLTMRAERTVTTFLALPSIVMEKTTLTGGRAEN